MHLATISEMHAQLLAMLCNTKANLPPQPPTPTPQTMVCLLRGSFKGKPLISHAQGAYFKGKKKQPWVCYLYAFSTGSHKHGLSFATPTALLQVAKNEQKTKMSIYVVFVQDVQASCIPNISV